MSGSSSNEEEGFSWIIHTRYIENFQTLLSPSYKSHQRLEFSKKKNYNNHHSKFDSGVYFIEISAWLSNFFPLQRESSLAVLPLLKKCYVERSMLLTSPLGHRNDWILINLFVFCSYTICIPPNKNIISRNLGWMYAKGKKKRKRKLLWNGKTRNLCGVCFGITSNMYKH